MQQNQVIQANTIYYTHNFETFGTSVIMQSNSSKTFNNENIHVYMFTQRKST